MSITRTRYRRKRKGVSTIMGTLIFVGILFTAVIPMFFVMNQADVLLDQSKLTIKHTDDEKSNEFANAYVFPTDPTSSAKITVQVFNKCEMPITIIRVWVNNNYTETNMKINPMCNDKYDILVNAQVGSSYDVRVTSERANTYAVLNGILSYILNSDGSTGWSGENYGINIVIPAKEPWMPTEKWDGPYDNFQVTIWKYDKVLKVKVGLPIYVDQKMTRAVSASESFLSLSEQGTYWVEAQVHMSQKGQAPAKVRPAHWHTIVDGDYTIEWPLGDPIIQVTLYAQDPSLPGCQTPHCPTCIAYNGG